jgi:alpha-L-rhamnosidase
MKKAEWIWCGSVDSKDVYADFVCDFYALTADDIVLKISSSTDYTAYINGKLAAFGQYADYPYYKVYDKIDITKFVKKGHNRLAVLAYHCGGEDFMTHYKCRAGLLFEIEQESKILACSSADTKCRQSLDYVSGRQIKITNQVGYSFTYDMSEYDGWKEKQYELKSFNNAEVTGFPSELNIRPVKKLELGSRAKSKLIKCGSFEFAGGDTIAQKQQYANINYDAAAKGGHISVKKGGVYALYDLGREEVGFLNFEIKTKEKTNISIGWGEHITDGRVRTSTSGRHFCAEYISRKGNQEFLGTFRRLGARYLQIFAETDEIEIKFLTLRPTLYPLTVKPFKAQTKLMQKIYDVSVRTLQLCMHEHYEDCPWREQALYTMDSRNQMLCGYYAFGEKDFARASLKLIGLDKCEDGLLSICYPSSIQLKIPSFSLHYIMQMNEYIEYTGDISLAEEFYPKLREILQTFTGRMEDGLVPIFYGDSKYWNFYEWEDTLSGGLGEKEKKHVDSVLNCLLSLALRNMICIAAALNKTNDISRYNSLIEVLNANINKRFFDDKLKLYKTRETEDRHSALANSLAILCGAAENGIREIIAEKLAYSRKDFIGPSISMNCFLYDALLLADKDKYADYILNDIEKIYGYMLEKGATSFWETIKGESDFDNAGSLCHGWSAMPVYYYHILKK